MIRLRMNGLMSRASTLALAAFAGVVGASGAKAGTTVTGPNQPHVHNTSNTDFVNIDTAIVGIDPNVGGVNSFANDPGIVIGGFSTGSGVFVTDSILQGRFVNSGTIFGDSDGVHASDSTFQQGLTNAGRIEGSSDGLGLYSTNLAGGITNTGTITGFTGAGVDILNFAGSSRTISGGILNTGTIQGDSGIVIWGSSPETVSGGISNSGRISADTGDAIFIGKGVTFSGGIDNTSTGKIIADSSDGIEIAAPSFAGGITNAGTIAGAATSSDSVAAINITSSVVTFSGGITNSGLISAVALTGTFTGTANGILIQADTFNGGIINTGTITSSDTAISLDSPTGVFNGGIDNQGRIAASTADAINVSTETFNDGITNSGVIEGEFDGIDIDGIDEFNGNIVNSGTIINHDSTSQGIEITADDFNGSVSNSGTILSAGEGILVENSGTSVFHGDGTTGIDNSGLIRSTSDVGIDIEASTFEGGVTNSGTIDAHSNGIEIDGGGSQTFVGGVTNSGTILAGNGGEGGATGDGLLVDLDDFQGGITNTSSGIIDARDDGMNVSALTFSGGITNAGTILAGSTGIDINVTNTFSGGVGNSGLIHAFSGTGVSIDPTIFNGAFTNSGTIIAEATTGNAIGVYATAGTFNGGIANSGLIDSEQQGIYVDVGAFKDGLTNSGTITTSEGSGTGIRVFANTFAGGLTNSGTIITNSSSGIRLTVANDFAGGVTNSGVIDSNDDAIHIDTPQTFAGGVTNSGTLTSGDDGIRTEGQSFAGGIKNVTGGKIFADESGIQVTNTVFSGGITNSGSITADSRGIDVNVTTFSNGINNSGLIIVDSTAVEVDATTFTGGFVNTGTIEGNSGDGVNFDVTTFSEGFNNSGTILATDTGVVFDGTTFGGGFTNSGLIDGSGTGVDINSTTFNGGFTNSGTIVGSDTGINFDGTNVNGGFTNTGRISANSYAVDIDVTNFVGNFTNSGTLEANSETTLNIDATNFTGNFENSGTITSATQTAVDISVTNFIGNISNSGLIEAQSNAFELSSTEISGNIVNSGTIHSHSSTALYLTSTEVGGYLSNSGIIQSDTDNAIVLSGSTVTGGVRNTGTILAALGSDAIDASSSSAPLTITLTSGVVEGDIDLRNGYEDTLNLNGGTLAGDLLGSIGDDVANVNAGSGEFAYLSGEISNFDRFYVNSGTAILGSNEVGNNGDGVTDGGEGINLVRVNSGATLYLDDDSVLDDVGDFTQETTGDTQFLLSLDTGVEKSGQIVADTIDLHGKITGVIDANAFANSGGLSSPFVYEDVFATSSGLSSDLSYNLDANGVTILNDLIFFDIQASTSDDDGTVDLIVDRLSFSEVLAAASQSSNQQNVGGVLEEIFNNGGYSSEFADAFKALLESSSYDEALAVYDQLLGAEHAQAALGALNIMNQFQGQLSERMDVLHNGMGTAKWAMFGQPGSQVAAAETVLADGSPSPAMGSPSLATPRDGNTISMWGGVQGNWASVDGDTNGPGFSQDTFGLSAGVDYAISSESIVGLGGSYLSSELDFDSSNSGDIDTFAVGAFGTFGLGGGYLDANANVAFHDLSTSRLTPAPDYANAEYSATSWSLSGEVGTVIPVGRAYVSPMLSLTYTGLSVDAFTETDSAFALAVQGSDTSSFATVLGARAGDYFKVGKAIVNLQGNLGWRHEFGDEEAAFTAAFVEDASLLFNVDSSHIASDAATFGVGSTVAISTSLEVFLNYDGVWNAEADSHNASLGVRANW
ncbi:MAG: autotransporter domain-containing protein [Micropepsaceae bacterium]